MNASTCMNGCTRPKQLVATFACAVSLLAAPTLAPAASGVGPYYAVPSWDQTLPASTRFLVLTNMNNEAVLDRETGLVWEQSPTADETTFEGALLRCDSLYKGGRLGWRLPTLQELASLVDRSANNPALPAGHPFSDIQTNYWTVTPYNSTFGLENGVVGFQTGNIFYGKGFSVGYWCVRGGQGIRSQ